MTRAPGHAAATLEVMGTPGTHNSLLRHGADCLVLHVAGGPVELLVSAYLAYAGAPVPALRVDEIGLDSAPAGGPALAAPAGPAPLTVPANGVSVVAHLERKGDAVAHNGAVLGDPASNLRLEGFQVMWPDKPDGVDIAYNIAVEGAGALPAVKTGKFCGTRGQARRITEVTFALIGPAASQYTLEGTAFFSGGFRVPVASGHALGGPSGLEHLTALSLNVKPAAARAASANPWDESPRTKVFKGKGAATAPAKPAATPAPVKKTPAAAKPVAAKKPAAKTVQAGKVPTSVKAVKAKK
ncbi:MAG: hypothetical protein ACXU8N_14860 [Telluria sp.]